VGLHLSMQCQVGLITGGGVIMGTMVVPFHRIIVAIENTQRMARETLLAVEWINTEGCSSQKMARSKVGMCVFTSQC